MALVTACSKPAMWHEIVLQLELATRRDRLAERQKVTKTPD